MAPSVFAGQSISSLCVEKSDMKAAVWDTYVVKKDGSIMHFDIIAPAEIDDSAVIHRYGLEYLLEKGQEGQTLTSEQCTFCHVESVRPAWEDSIGEKGYFIFEIDNC